MSKEQIATLLRQLATELESDMVDLDQVHNQLTDAANDVAVIRRDGWS